MGAISLGMLGVAFTSVLVTVTVTDLDRRVIPNAILAAGAAVGLAIIVPADPGSVPGRAIAAATAGGFLLLGTIADRDGMGMGDVKLAALMGLYLGPAVAPAMLVAFAAGGLVAAGLVVRDGAAARRRALPFGPFLALGGVTGLVAGDRMIAWYLDRF
jgi:leader peptidase (prepilin peptidase) / N-methyltransferase